MSCREWDSKDIKKCAGRISTVPAGRAASATRSPIRGKFISRYTVPMKSRSSKITLDEASYIRNFVFGVEDSLVSTVGLLSGVAIAGVPRETIFLTGAVLIFVEAISMAAGSFLSESSAEEFEKKSKVSSSRALIDAVIMFVSYFLSGFVPLAPYIFLQTKEAFVFSNVLSLLALFLLGAVGARLSRMSIWRSGLRMLLVGGLAILVGMMVGNFFA